MSCPDCVRDAEHCHGALILCADGTVECSDDACTDTGRDRHDLVVVAPGERGLRFRPGAGGTPRP